MVDVTAAAPARRSLLSRVSPVRLKGSALALGGMLAGAMVGIGVQAGIESTGMLGPSVSALIEEQQANFSDVHSRLDALQGAASDPAIKQSLAELATLLERQDQLAQQANAELRTVSNQMTDLRDRQLDARGFTGGADVWLKEGEGINVGARDQVFGVLQIYGNGSTDVNMSGTRKRLATGDLIQVEAAGRSCTVLLKQGVPREDGRLGFDLACS